MIVLSVLQATEYIFKYIIQSRRLFSLATGGQNEEEFRVCIHELFMSIRFFLSQENKGASPVAQTQVCLCVPQIICSSTITSVHLCVHVFECVNPGLSVIVKFLIGEKKMYVIEFHAARGCLDGVGISVVPFPFLLGGLSSRVAAFTYFEMKPKEIS